jgi:hypothetical protein
VTRRPTADVAVASGNFWGDWSFLTRRSFGLSLRIALERPVMSSETEPNDTDGAFYEYTPP